MARGFASMSRKRLVEVSSKGGKASINSKAHRFSTQTAKINGSKGVQKRMENLAAEAAIRLLKYGFTREELEPLKLSLKEYIYYGGRTSTGLRRDELAERIEVANRL